MESLQDTAAQLRCPSGGQALEMAQKMNEIHGTLNRKCIELMHIRPGDCVLETGPGNGAFAGEIVGDLENVFYTGIDWSSDMVMQARTLHADLIESGRVEFLLGDSSAIPFEAQCFDKALTVHTIYFWDDPAGHLVELERVLKPGGLLCIAFADRTFTEKMPFAQLGFKLYHAQDVRALLEDSGFLVQDVRQIAETSTTETGEIVDKLFNVILATTRPMKPATHDSSTGASRCEAN
ncbi:class I SAM-dependent methyltransferase [Thauera sp. Sel9]|uniref:class I SAM-dependent methyltransferase n=1 Tax=Thauera sp. Sel9 TaxID=2974299 RepID=UPI0021E13A46|nr:class I SAM-dependent methyltransferase [Thauera sp. Sel9]MCV2218056.1 class I SAM-dependent methyltransferase [Thauera sp. Sel9]